MADETTTADALTVTVDASALRQVLRALIGPPYLIRELQATRGPLFTDNPIDLLVKQFNEEMDKRIQTAAD